MIQTMISYVEENALISLSDIVRKLEFETGVRVSISTAHRVLEGRLYSIKLARMEPVTMNSVVNREKRMVYVNRLLAFQGNGKKIIYMDETNVNLFLRRKHGRNKKGTRCSVKSPTSRGKNIHIIGAISQTGLLYWERRRG